MEVSNSLPIQLWVNGEETFNEKDVCGITKVCWCQPVQSEDDIIIQFNENSGTAFYGFIYDSDGNAIINFEFNKIAVLDTYQYHAEFKMSDYSITNNQVHIWIGPISEIPVISSEFETDLDGWTQIPSLYDWEWANSPDYFADGVPGYAIKSLEASDFTSLSNSISLNAGETITIKTQFGGIKDLSDFYLEVYIAEGLTSLQIANYLFEKNSGIGDNYRTIDETIVVPSDLDHYDQVYFIIKGDTEPGNKGYVNYFRLSYEGINTDNIVGKTDCLSVRDTHPCTILVNYANATAFDGVPDSSPMQSFNLRIPAVFFEEQNTQEQEDIELSNDEIVRLYNKVEEKRLLKIGFMPHYMHRKLLLALVHDFVTIDGKEWIKRDEYKKNEGNRHYPLKSAEVLLTDKNFIKENQL